MANLSIASKCNRSCAYCFATDMLAEMPDSTSFMSKARFEQAMDFVERCRMEEIRLLGGEPTIHPEFRELIALALERGLRILVFTGGLIPERALAAIEETEPSELLLLLNVLHPQEGRASERRRQREVMKRLGARISLGLTICEPGVELAFLLDLIRRYGLRKRVRLGIAHPDPAGRNQYLHPNHYPEAGVRAAAFAIDALEQGISVELDCGWVPCMFPDGALEHLGIRRDQVGVTCSPIPDVLSNGQAISCYPLSHLGHRPLPANGDAARLRARFEADQRRHRLVTLYDRCLECRWHRSGACKGGCLAASMRRYRRTDFSFTVTGQDPAAASRPEATHA